MRDKLNKSDFYTNDVDITYLTQRISTAQVAAQDKILNALISNSNIMKFFRKDNIKPKKGKGKHILYNWIMLTTNKNNIFWITLFLNDIDDVPGNIHTFCDRIQFWSDIKIYEAKGNNGKITKRYGPNENLDGKWFVCNKKSSNHRIMIDEINKESFDMGTLIGSFIKFVKKRDK